MLDALKWWLAVQLLGVVALPLCLALFAPLADRGYGLSKTFGLLLFGYVVWLLGLTHVIPNGPIAYVLAVVVLAGASFLALHRTREGGGHSAPAKSAVRPGRVEGTERLLAGARMGWRETASFIRRRRGLLLIQEAVFLVAYLAFLWVRSHNPEIQGTEKFMDFAFVNAVTRSTSFPPLDPWLAPLAGAPTPTINYYHFGYLIQGLLLRLTGVHPAVGFNLALAMLFGLTALSAFSLCYGLARDLVAERTVVRRPMPDPRSEPPEPPLPLGEGQGEGFLRAEPPHRIPHPLLRSGLSQRERQTSRQAPSWSFRAARQYLVVGGLGTFLLLISGNLWTFLRRVDGSGLWDKDFWQGIGWNATRVLVIKRGEQDLDYTINEFPAFSFLLGDLHPHVLALPFAVLAVGLAYAWLMRPPRLYRWAVSGEALPARTAGITRLAPLAELLPGALVLGSLYFLNSWDFPAYFSLAQAAALAGAWWLRESASLSSLPPTIDADEEEPDSALSTQHSGLRSVGAVALVGVLALALFLPFHATFKPPVVTDANSPLPLGLVTQRSFLSQFLQFWGIQLLLVAPILATAVALSGGLRWVAPVFSGSLRRAQAPGIIARGQAGWEPALLIAGVLLFTLLIDRIGSGALLLSLLLAWGAAHAAREALEPVAPGTPAGLVAGRRPLAFALGLLCVAALLLAACEVVYIRDFYGGTLRRMNTVFKLYYQAWLLFAVGGAVGAYWLFRTLRARRARPGGRAALGAFLALGAVLVLAALHFPIRAAQLRTDSFRTPSTLNGMAWLQQAQPDDHAAAEWLRANGPTAGTPPVILEATGGAYSEFARMATQTGFPTVLGWDQHERLWRGAAINEEVETRKRDVAAIYGAPSLDLARPLLEKYGVSYIVVGYLEQKDYSASGGLAKFQDGARSGGVALQQVFSQGRTAIYRVVKS